MLKLRVKSVPIPEWCNERGVRAITAFNNQDKPLFLELYTDSVDTLEAMQEVLDLGDYGFDYPDCPEADVLKDLVDDSLHRAKHLEFNVSDLYFMNPDDHLVTVPDYTENRVPIHSGDYTLLHNVRNEWWVVAYKYNISDNTWESGRHFNDIESALTFMYSGLEHNYELLEQVCYVANNIPSDWFDAAELAGVVKDVVEYCRLNKIELEVQSINAVLKTLGYCS